MQTNANQTKENGKKLFITFFMTLFFTPVIEKILTPAYTFTINQLFSTGSAFTQFISNLFYSRISEGVYINISFYIFIVIISLILIKIVNPCIPRKVPCDAVQTEASCQKNTCQFSQRVKCLFIDLLNQTKFKQFSFITLYIVFIFLILTTNFINKTITQTMNNIEIVSPYISDYDYKMLKSNFHSMKSRTDYDKLMNTLETISEANGIELK